MPTDQLEDYNNGERQEEARRLRGRIEAVIDYGKAHGWRSSSEMRLAFDWEAIAGATLHSPRD